MLTDDRQGAKDARRDQYRREPYDEARNIGDQIDLLLDEPKLKLHGKELLIDIDERHADDDTDLDEVMVKFFHQHNTVMDAIRTLNNADPTDLDVPAETNDDLRRFRRLRGSIFTQREAIFLHWWLKTGKPESLSTLESETVYYPNFPEFNLPEARDVLNRLHEVTQISDEVGDLSKPALEP